jgi:His-Xaa-Ser system radical SAM maturase HxsC
MCSQPPKNVNDSWLIKEAEYLIPLIPKTAPEIGFTGGEPTLYGERFIRLLTLTKNYLPKTAVHVLSNGRRFADMQYAKDWSSIRHHDLMVGIPIYSDDPSTHDYVVQARGAFDEAVKGVLNLKRLSQRVEVRVVIHKQTIGRLPQLAEWICRNLLFVDHVALMGLEMIGFARANIDKLWIDPYDYKDVLSEAVRTLHAYGIPTSVYNHQLCVVNADIQPFYRKSISDWKNEYVDECRGCVRLSQCGGFFTSSKLYRYSDHIRPFLA